MGMTQGQRNLLLRVVIRHPERTLTDAEANKVASVRWCK
jgi:phenylalanyl-tRNA synthetase beta subunit